MEVLEMNQDAYTVLDIVSRRNQAMHKSRLYLFFYDDISWCGKHRCPRLWIKCSRIYFGRYDRQEDSKRQWQFRIRWRGYDEDENTWNSWDFKSGRSVTNLSTQSRSSAIYPIISQIPSGKTEKKPKKRSTPEEQPEEPIQTSEKKQKRNRLRKNNRNRRFNREQNEPRQRNSDSRHKAFFEFFLGRNNYSIGFEF